MPESLDDVDMRRWQFFFGLQFLIVLAVTNVDARQAELGLAVSELQEIADDRGLKTGDRLLSWREGDNVRDRENTSDGPLNTLEDWIRLVNEVAIGGPIVLLVDRDNHDRIEVVVHSLVDLDVRPGLPTPLSSDFHRVLADYGAGKRENAVLRLVELAANAKNNGFTDLHWWSMMRAASLCSDIGQKDRAEQLLTELLAESGGARLKAETLTARGLLNHKNNKPTAAEADFLRAIEVLGQQQEMVLQRGKIMRMLGVSQYYRGDLIEAERIYHRIVELVTPRAPQSPLLAKVFNNLGIVEDDRGHFSSAEAYYQKAYAIFTRQAPESLDIGMVLNNLGVLNRQRGNFSKAETYYLKALSVKKKISPDSLDVAYTLTNLGVLAEKRGDFRGAFRYHEQALKLKEKHAPGSAAVATTLINLGVVSDVPGTGQRHLQRACRILEEQSPRSILMAQCLNNMATLEEKMGRSDLARDYYNRSFELLNEITPGSLLLAQALFNQADIAMTTGEYEHAEDFLRRSLDIREKLAGGSVQEAKTLNLLGKLYQHRGRIPEAHEAFRRSIDSLDQQIGMIGGTDEIRSLFRSGNMSIYQDYLGLLVEEQRFAEAYHVLERSRAKLFLQILEERDLDFSESLPVTLEEKRVRLRDDYRALKNELSSLSIDGDFEQCSLLMTRLNDLAEERRVFREMLRRTVPRFASMTCPESLDLDSTRASLTAGTLLVAYMVGESHTFCFSLGPGKTDFAVHIIPAGRAMFVELVRLLRVSITQKDNVIPLSRKIGDLLLGPIVAEIERAERLLISPDMPLSSLPFSILIPGGQHGEKMLIELKPLHYTLSMTVYNELKKRVRSDRHFHLVAVGGPDYRSLRTMLSQPEPDFIPATFLNERRQLPDISESLEEIQVLEDLFPHSSVLLIGAKATERNVRREMLKSTLLHVATHSYYDASFPLESSLVLSMPDSDRTDSNNGFLQAWEIIESVRMECDLVVLSGCDTARGRDTSGEGVIGLTQAFHYAGAASVLSSTWFISDSATSHLMEHFYSFLAQSMPIDSALQHAQRAMIATKKWSHPFYWASFQLSGYPGPLELPAESGVAFTKRLSSYLPIIVLCCLSLIPVIIVISRCRRKHRTTL